MNETKPLKRAPALQPLSREHHEGLLFVWKIRQGIRTGVSTDRLRAYTGWYFKEHIRPHFFQEEKILLPLLPDHPHTKRMTREHEMIRELIIDIDRDTLRGDLVHLANLIEKHIRFEEREFFAFLQEYLSSDTLQYLEQKLLDLPHCNSPWKDEFWNKSVNSTPLAN